MNYTVEAAILLAIYLFAILAFITFGFQERKAVLQMSQTEYEKVKVSPEQALWAKQIGGGLYERYCEEGGVSEETAE